MKKLVFFVIVVLAIVLTACSKADNLEDTYFVSILPQKYFVERVIGDLYNVEVLVKPGESPATYEPTTKQMIKLSKAKALFTIGVAFEDNLIPKLREQYENLAIIPTDKNVKKMKPANYVQLFEEANLHHDFEKEDHHQDLEKENDNHHHHENLDPHIWLSPDLVKTQVANITDYFNEAYPDKRNYFSENRDAFIAELDEVTQEINNIFNKVEKKEFLCFHPAWGYFADQFDLKQIPIEIEGKEPTPKEQQRILEFAKEKGIKYIFVQAQFDQRVASSIAKEIGGSVILIDPLAENYLVNLKNIADKLAERMGK